MRLALGFEDDFAAGFRGKVTVFATLEVDFLVATFYIFLKSVKVFLNKAKKFGMFNTYGCARAHAR